MENGQATAINSDLENLGDQIFKPTNANQGIDIIRLRDYWLGLDPDTELGRSLKFQHLELIELVMETGFLATIESARRQLQASDERTQSDPEPEDVLPSRH